MATNEKKSKPGFFKRVVYPFIDVPRWMSLKGLVKETKDFSELAKDVFVPQKAEHKETFEQAIARLNLTEADIQASMVARKRLALVFLMIGVIILGYGVYMLISSYYAAAFMSVVVALIALAMAFKEHFWYFQMKQRRLGMTIKQYLKANFKTRGAQS